MMTVESKTYPLLLDKNRCEHEAALICGLESLKRGKRQEHMRELILFANKLNEYNPVLFKAISGYIMNAPQGQNLYEILISVVDLYEKTEQSVGVLAPKTLASSEPKPVSESAPNPEPAQFTLTNYIG